MKEPVKLLIAITLAFIFIMVFALVVMGQIKGGLAVQRVVRVVDGDTVVLNRGGKLVTCRLIGVDTPETHHPTKPPEPYGVEAEEYLRWWLEGYTVRVDYEYPEGSPYRKDRYKRLLVYLVTKSGQVVNLEMVKRGYGRFDPGYRTKYRAAFKAAESEAKMYGMGLWGLTGTWVPQARGGYYIVPQPKPHPGGVPAHLSGALAIINQAKGNPYQWDDRLARSAQEHAQWAWQFYQSGGNFSLDAHHDFYGRLERAGWIYSDDIRPPGGRNSTGNASEWCGGGTLTPGGWVYPARSPEDIARNMVWMVTESNLVDIPGEEHVTDFRAGYNRIGIGHHQGMFVVNYGYER